MKTKAADEFHPGDKVLFHLPNGKTVSGFVLCIVPPETVVTKSAAGLVNDVRDIVATLGLKMLVGCRGLHQAYSPTEDSYVIVTEVKLSNGKYRAYSCKGNRVSQR